MDDGRRRSYPEEALNILRFIKRKASGKATRKEIEEALEQNLHLFAIFFHLLSETGSPAAAAGELSASRDATLYNLKKQVTESLGTAIKVIAKQKLRKTVFGVLSTGKCPSLTIFLRAGDLFDQVDEIISFGCLL